MALSLVRFGDIHGFVNGFEFEWVWRVGLTAVGLVLSFIIVIFAGRTLDEFLGQSQRRARAAKLEPWAGQSYCSAPLPPWARPNHQPLQSL
jgi:hypothetical protein